MSIESFYAQKEIYESIQALENCALDYMSFDELQFMYREFSEFNTAQVTARHKDHPIDELFFLSYEIPRKKR